MSNQKRTYQDLENELEKANEIIDAFRGKQVDAIIGKDHVSYVRLKEVEDKLRETRQKYERLVEHAPTGIYEIDFVNRKLLTVNEVMSTYTGYTREELLSMDPMDLLTDSSKKKFAERLKLATEGKKPSENVEYEVKTKDGDVIWVLINISFVKQKGRITQAFVVAQDVTNRKKIEQDLSKREQELENLADNAPDLIFRIDRQMRHVFVNQRVLDMTGLQREACLGRTNREMGFPSELCDLLEETFHKTFEMQKMQEVDFTFQSPIGPRVLLMRVVPEFSDDGSVNTILGITRDITDLKKIEEKLSESEIRRKKAERMSRIGHVEFDVKDSTIFWSEVMYDIYGREISLGPPSYKQIISFHDPEDAEKLKKGIKKAIQDAKPYEMDLKVNVDSTNTSYVHVIGKPIKNDKGNVVKIIGTVQDITQRKQVESVLQKSEHQLKLAQEASNVVSLEINNQTGSIGWIGNINMIFGQISENEINTMDKFLKQIHPEDQENVRNVIQTCINNQDELWIEHRIINPDGTIKWVEEIGKAYYDSKVNQVILSGIIHDITKEKNWDELQEKLYADIEKERNILEVIMENTHAHLAYLDPHFNFVDVNSSYAEASGFKKEDLIGNNHFDFFPDKEKEVIFKQVRDTKEKVEYKAKPFTIPGSNETTYWNWTLNPILDKNSKLLGFVLSLVDVTDLKKNEERILSLNKSLMTRTTELAITNNELEAFTYSASHDLRAPLRSINGFSEILLEDYQDRLDEEGQDYLQRICKSAQKMSQLINDLLKLSRISRAELKKNTFNLSAMATDIIDEFKQEEANHKITAKIEPNIKVKADKNLMRIVLTNLIGNACKFTKNKSNPSITIGTTKKDEDTVYYVRDNGVGFDQQYADKLFIPFQRLHDEKDYPGSGIGLPLVARVIHRHNGEIWGKGKKEQGATFYFTLDTHSQ